MAEAEQLRFGTQAKAASELSDSELERELHERRRRRARAGREPDESPGGSASSEEVGRYFANLELSAGARIADVHASYDRLVAKYEPYASHADPERSRAARALLGSLERAYRGLLAHMDADEP